MAQDDSRDLNWEGGKRNVERLLPWAIFLLSFVLLLGTLHPTYPPDDSAETAAVAETLGIAHPPGYPLYGLVSNAALKVLSGLGDVPLQLNILSLLWAAWTGALVCRFLLSRGLAPLWAGALGLITCLHPLVWEQATSAKGGYYTLAGLFSVALLFCASARKAAAFFFVLGLCLAHHWMTGVLCGLSMILVWVATDRLRGERGPGLGGLWWGFLGLGLWLYLPLRAAAEPRLNWENPVNLENFLWALFRRGYLGAEGSRDLATTLGQAAHLLQTFLGPWILAGLGVLVLSAKARGLKANQNRDLLLALAPLALWAVFSPVYLNLTEERFYLMEAYSSVFLPLAPMALGLWIRERGLKRGLSLFAWAGALGLFLSLRPAMDRSRDSFAYDLCHNVLSSAPGHSLILAKGDGMVFPLWYECWVRGRRQDLALAGVDGLSMKWIRTGLERYGKFDMPEFSYRVGNEAKAQLINHLAREALKQDRPLVASFNKADPGSLAETEFLPWGLVWRLGPVGASWGRDPGELSQDILKAWAPLRLRGVFQDRRHIPERVRKTLIHDYGVSLNSAGVFFEEAGLSHKGTGLATPWFSHALSWFDRARAMDPANHEYDYNVGNALHRLKRWPQAIEAYNLALAKDPTYTAGWYNLGLTHMKQGSPKEAGLCARRVLDLEPGHQGAQTLLRWAQGH